MFPSSRLAVLFLAAGKSRRMRSAASKVMHPLWGVPVLARTLEAAQGLGSRFVVVSPGAGDILSILPSGVKIAVQKQALGTGHAVLCAEKHLRGFRDVLVMAGDAPLLRPATLKALVRKHLREKNAITLLAAEMENPRGYGRVLLDGRGRLLRMVEESDASAAERDVRLVNSGTYVFSVKPMLAALRRTGRGNRQKEYYLPDAVMKLLEGGRRVGVHVLSDWTEALGVNTRADLARAHEVLRWRRVQELMEEGVTFLDPRTAWVAPDTEIGPDSVVEPCVFIGGGTKIGPRCRVGMGSHLSASTLAADVTLRPYTVLEEAVVEEGASVGPFARLRPGTRVGKRARIGNFVETKKAVFGDEAKASHLSYVGDAAVGRGVNIGAGVITCNYDGVNKHRTVLEDGVFVGSDAQLVAPVTVGRGAYVGAGSTITRDVPAGALAVSRAEQRTIEGWAARRAAHNGAAKKGKV